MLNFSFNTPLRCFAITAVFATTTVIAATTTVPSTTTTQAQTATTSAIPPLPHGGCPERYRLDFVAQTWIRCSLKRSEIDKGASKMPSYAAPKCEADYALRGPTLSNAPEKSMYQCVRFQR